MVFIPYARFRRNCRQTSLSNKVRWHGRVMRRDSNDTLRRALDFEVDGKRKQGRPEMARRQLEESIRVTGLKKEICHWQSEVAQCSLQNFVSRKVKSATSINGNKTRFKTDLSGCIHTVRLFIYHIFVLLLVRHRK